MANVKISDLTAAAAATGTQQFEVNESGTSKRVTGAQLLSYIEGEISSSPALTGQVSLDDGTASAPSLTNTGDTNTGIYFPAADEVAISTGGSERVKVNSSGQVEVIAGSASTPAITTTGDLNTGVYFPAADTIAFVEGGAEAMRIDSSGNVGIGTNAPTYNLDVQSSGETIIRAKTTGTASAWFVGEAGASGSVVWHNNSNTPSIFTTNGTEKFRIGTSGQLGVGGENYGTSGQVLTSGGSSAAPSWATVVSGLQYISGGESPTLSFTSIPQYTSLFLIIQGGNSSSTNANIRVALSSNNGSSYGTARQVTSSDNECSYTSYVHISNTKNNGASKVITPNSITLNFSTTVNRINFNNTTSTESTVTGIIDAIQITGSNGNAEFIVTLYGIP